MNKLIRLTLFWGLTIGIILRYAIKGYWLWVAVFIKSSYMYKLQFTQLFHMSIFLAVFFVIAAAILVCVIAISCHTISYLYRRFILLEDITIKETIINIKQEYF